jgi:hypothetical protein
VLSFTGNTTIAGNLGIGTVSPATQSHLQASASVVESRLENTAAATCTIMQSLKTATQQWEMSLARGGSQDRSFVVFDRSNSKMRVELTQDGIIKTFAGTNTKDTTFELVMADGTSVNLTSYCGGGSYGILQVATGLSATCGSVFLKGGFNTVQELQDASNSISITDTAGQLCFLSAGSGQFNVKNRLGTTATISFRFVGQ